MMVLSAKFSSTHDLRTPQAMNMLDYPADQRIFSFERTSPFRGLLGGIFEAKIKFLLPLGRRRAHKAFLSYIVFYSLLQEKN
jgi:hypothetical protein